MIEAQLMLKAKPGLAANLLSEMARAGKSGEVAVARRLPDEALPSLAHAASAAPDLPDCIVSSCAEHDSDLERTMADLAKRMRPLSAEASLVVVRRHAVLPGRDAIRLFFGLRRLERLSLPAFHDYWLHRHAAIGRRLIPPHSYHQLHADPGLSAQIAEAASVQPSTLDGIVEVHFPDVPALIAQLSRPEVAEEALADERNFIDHARSIFWAYAEI
ncbi:MAG: EthD domain-containing protein [Sphingobium phenoxybenzoativorans]